MAGGDPIAVRDALREVSRRELVSPARGSSIQGEAEYTFWHGLVRDVCYSQIPRAAKARMHRAAAQWIERAAADRLEDLAEVLAHHYTTALQLTKVAGPGPEASDLESPTLRFLVMAGDRALGLDVARAKTHYAKALELARSDDVEHPELLAKWAEAIRQTGGSREAAEALEKGIAGFLARGDRLSAGRAMGTLSSVLHALGNARQEEVAREAVRILESQPPGPDLVAAYARMAGVKLVRGDMHETIDWVDRAIALAASLGLVVPARALGFRGYARCSLGDADGLRDMRAALALATERGEGRDAAVLYNNLAVAVWPIEGPTGVLGVVREGIEFSERRGIEEFAVALSAASLDQLVDTGAWDSALDIAESLDRRAEASGDVADLLQARWSRARVLGLRGDGAGAAPLADWLVDAARESGGVEDIIAGLTAAAIAYRAVGRVEHAVELLTEIAETPHVQRSPMYPPFLCEMTRTALAAGDLDLAARLGNTLEPIFPYHEHALCGARAILAEARGDRAEGAKLYAEAAERWERFGVVPERAFALLGQGRCMVALAVQEAPAVLREAREIFGALKAKPALAEIDALLERATALTS
jgi:tetratricopeptide (TPR) repeat protein